MQKVFYNYIVIKFSVKSIIIDITIIIDIIITIDITTIIDIIIKLNCK